MDMKSISQKLQDDIRAVMEANIKHPNQQALNVHEPEKDKITAHDFKKLRAMKKTPDGKVHNCATHVEHAVLGKGTTVSEEHAEPDAEGNIEWYTVQFEHSTQQVLTKDLTITMSEAHMHESSEEQVDEEEKKKVVSPFDYKNYKSQIPTKPGETAGFDSKKISTGTVYSRKPVKEESHQSKTTMKHIPNASPALKKAAKDIKPGIAGIGDRFAMLRAGGVKGGPGGVKEEMEQIDEITKSEVEHHHDEWMNSGHAPYQSDAGNDPKIHKQALRYLSTTDVPKEKHEELALHIADKFHGSGIGEAYQTAKSEFVARQGRLTAAAAETEKDPARLKRMSNIPGYSAAMGLAKKTTQGAKHTKEEFEQIDELSVNTLNRVHGAAVRDANNASRDGDEARADKRYNLAGKASNKAELKNRAAGLKPSGQHAMESVEQKEYTFADYLDAVRSQYGDEDAVLIANEAFKNKDITLFNYQSQSPEA